LNVVVHALLNNALIDGEERSLDAGARHAIPVEAIIICRLVASRGVIASVSLSIAGANFAGSITIRASVSGDINAAVSDESGGSEATLNSWARINRDASTASGIAVAAATRTTRELVNEANSRGQVNRIQSGKISQGEALNEVIWVGSQVIKVDGHHSGKV
jgi:hypothetical protein